MRANPKPSKSKKNTKTKRSRRLLDTVSRGEDQTGDSSHPESTRLSIGQEVRFWRRKEGMTGAALARSSGISAGMLSKIEKGVVAPSIQTLMTIAAALNVPTSIFFHRIEKSRYVSFVPAGKGLTMDKRGTRADQHYEMLGHAIGHVIGVEPFLVTLTDESKPYPYFQEEGLKLVYILEGRLNYQYGDREFPLRAGDTLIFDATTLHGPLELLETPIRLLSINMFSRFDPESR